MQHDYHNIGVLLSSTVKLYKTHFGRAFASSEQPAEDARGDHQSCSRTIPDVRNVRSCTTVPRLG